MLKALQLYFSSNFLDSQKVAAFFRKNPSLINLKNSDGDSPLHTAVRQGTFEMNELRFTN